MTSVIPAAPAANPETRVDLSDEVCREAFAEGIRARWLPEVGLVEMTTSTRGGVDIWDQENASTEAKAVDWVRFYGDYDSIIAYARGEA